MLMMLPFEAPTIFEGIHKSYFRMPRVVKDQRSKFENDDLFRQLSHESAVKYTGFKDRPLEERQMKFFENCHQLPVGHTEVSIVQSGNQFTLVFDPTLNPAYNNQGCDFNKEQGKVGARLPHCVCVALCDCGAFKFSRARTIGVRAFPSASILGNNFFLAQLPASPEQKI